MINKDTKTHILVVDDQSENINILGNMLSDTYEIAVALNGQDAITIASSKPYPDLILLDIMMPEMDGFETCRKLKVNPDTKDIPIIFLTALNDTENIIKGFDEGAVDYVSKPFNPK